MVEFQTSANAAMCSVSITAMPMSTGDLHDMSTHKHRTLALPQEPRGDSHCVFMLPVVVLSVYTQRQQFTSKKCSTTCTWQAFSARETRTGAITSGQFHAGPASYFYHVSPLVEVFELSFFFFLDYVLGVVTHAYSGIGLLYVYPRNPVCPRRSS